jgi:uncharacterized iron-regulated membrane protein
MQAVLSVLRRILFWSHLVLGVAAGLVILLMSVTGVLLGYERQVIAWMDGAPRVEAPAGVSRLPLDRLLAGADVAREEVASVLLRAAEHEPVTVRFRDRERPALVLDPYTGAAVAPPADSAGRKSMAALRRWHRWVGAEGGELRTQMKAVTGASNLAFLGLVMSGIWLWWPRRLTWTAIRNVLWFRGGLGPKARDFNWHNTIGFWTAVPLFFVVASGVFISYRWPGLWLDRLLGSEQERAAAVAALTAAPEGRESRASGGGRSGTARDEAPVPEPAALAPLQAYLDSAAVRSPDWRSVTLTLPSPGDSVVSVATAGGNTYRPDLRATVRLDARTASAQEVSDYASLSASRKIRAWVRFGHTGEVFGLTGQTIATLASLGGAFLVWTGIALSLRRLAAWWRRRRNPPSLSAAPSTKRGRAATRATQPVA